MSQQSTIHSDRSLTAATDQPAYTIAAVTTTMTMTTKTYQWCYILEDKVTSRPRSLLKAEKF